jgi:hypothetical protein
MSTSETSEKPDMEDTSLTKQVMGGAVAKASAEQRHLTTVDPLVFINLERLGDQKDLLEEIRVLVETTPQAQVLQTLSYVAIKFAKVFRVNHYDVMLDYGLRKRKAKGDEEDDEHSLAWHLGILLGIWNFTNKHTALVQASSLAFGLQGVQFFFPEGTGLPVGRVQGAEAVGLLEETVLAGSTQGGFPVQPTGESASGSHRCDTRHQEENMGAKERDDSSTLSDASGGHDNTAEEKGETEALGQQGAPVGKACTQGTSKPKVKKKKKTEEEKTKVKKKKKKKKKAEEEKGETEALGQQVEPVGKPCTQATEEEKGETEASGQQGEPVGKPSTMRRRRKRGRPRRRSSRWSRLAWCVRRARMSPR